MVIEPRQIAREIIDYIGDKGVIAGGAVRDIVMERIPKDYDIFIFGETDFIEIIERKGIFDKIPKVCEAPFGIIEGYNKFTVWNTTLHGEPIQIIWAKEFEKGFIGRNGELRINTSITPEELV